MKKIKVDFNISFSVRLLALLMITAYLSLSCTSTGSRYTTKQGKDGYFDYSITIDNSNNSQSLSITGYRGPGGDVVIPYYIKNVKVTFIDAYAFADKGLTSITIPESVNVIGNLAFSNIQLSRITILGKITYLGLGAFSKGATGYIAAYGSGTYELWDEQWYKDGTILIKPACLIISDGVIFMRINGQNPLEKYSGVNKDASDKYHTSYYFPPGFYTIEAKYNKRTYAPNSYQRYTDIWTDGTVTLRSYFLEGGIYDLTGIEQNRQILFNINKREQN